MLYTSFLVGLLFILSPFILWFLRSFFAVHFDRKPSELFKKIWKFSWLGIIIGPGVIALGIYFYI